MAAVTSSVALLLVLCVAGMHGMTCKNFRKDNGATDGMVQFKSKCCGDIFNSENIFRTAVCCTDESTDPKTCLCKIGEDLAGNDPNNPQACVQGADSPTAIAPAGTGKTICKRNLQTTSRLLGPEAAAVAFGGATEGDGTCKTDGLIGFLKVDPDDADNRVLVCNGAIVNNRLTGSWELWTTESCWNKIKDDMNNVDKKVFLTYSGNEFDIDGCILDELTSKVPEVKKFAISEALTDKLNNTVLAISPGCKGSSACIAMTPEEMAQLNLKECRIMSLAQQGVTKGVPYVKTTYKFTQATEIELTYFVSNCGKTDTNRKCFKSKSTAGTKVQPCNENDEGALLYCSHTVGTGSDVSKEWVLRGFVQSIKDCTVSEEDFPVSII